MAKYGDDKALSMGGALPGQVVNGLVEKYERLCKTADTVYCVVAMRTDYVKFRPDGSKPDEPVLKVAAVEVGEGEDEQTLVTMMDRLRAARNGEETLASQPELSAVAD